LHGSGKYQNKKTALVPIEISIEQHRFMFSVMLVTKRLRHLCHYCFLIFHLLRLPLNFVYRRYEFPRPDFLAGKPDTKAATQLMAEATTN
jgi:hypothetical protein